MKNKKRPDNGEMNHEDLKDQEAVQNLDESIDLDLDVEEVEEETSSDTDPKDEALAQITDKYIRLMAEYDNFRKRTRQEKEQLYEQSVTDVVGQWLTVIDNLERAMTISQDSENQEVKQFAEGLTLVLRQVDKTLEQLKVVKIDPLGETFNPNLHSAVLHIDDDSFGSSEIVEVFEKGYERNGRVIRHAIVKVAN